VCELTHLVREAKSEVEAESMIVDRLTDDPAVNAIVCERIDVVLELLRIAAKMKR